MKLRSTRWVAARLVIWFPPPLLTLGRFKNRGRRWWMGVALGLTSILMVVAAVGLVAYPFLTDLRAMREQRNLAAEFNTDSLKQAYAAGDVGEGKPLTQIVIPKLGVDTIVVQGTSAVSLRAGAGHYYKTPLPGEPGNVGIAGHSGMNGKPFDRIQRLKPGDQIVLITPLAKHTYEVTPPASGKKTNPWVTNPWDWSVVEQSEEPLLTLTTCFPRGSSKNRLIVRAKLMSSEATA